jgi:hypothetical protein
LAAIAVPGTFFAPVVIVAVYTVLDASALVGLNDAIDPEYDTVPGTEVAPCLSVKVTAVSVNGSIGTLNVAAPILLVTTPVALFNGSVDVTVGATVAEVLNVQMYGVCKAFPIGSFTEVATVPVYVVLGFSFVLGTNVMVNVAASYVIEPDTWLLATRPAVSPGASTLSASGVIVAGFIASLKVTVIFPSSGTPAAEFAGVVDTTIGHTPMASMFWSLQPPKKAATKKAAIADIHIFFVFIIL